MPATRQLRLLLWKDYLTRKRKLITLAGVIWATAVLLSIYIVRANVDNLNYSTCQFPARALPSSGMVPFLQSFICSVNNDCESLDKFDEIPTYENSKFTQLHRQIAPLLYNETVLDVAASMPNALKLLSKVAYVVDEPTFVDISKNGLKVGELFSNPSRVKRYLSSRLNISNAVTNSLMTSELSFQGVSKGSLNRCSVSSISDTFKIMNKDHLHSLMEKLCSLSDSDVQKTLMDLMMEVDFNKFIKIIGTMYSKLKGDDRLTKLADTMTAVIRMMRLQNFLPRELATIFQQGDTDFSYFDLGLIQRFINLFQPTFGDTVSYKNVKEFADTIVTGVKYLEKFFVKQSNNTDAIENKSDVADVNNVTKAFDTIKDVFKTMEDDNSIDAFDVLSQITKFIYKWLPDNHQHDVLLYSTLLTKLIEGANKVISINVNIEERTYTVCSRHPEGVKILVNLPSNIISNGFDALASAERTQVMTAKITTPSQMFCDLNRLQRFFKITKSEATSLRTQLCTDAWKNLVIDLIKSFGVYEVKDNINAMASILIQETLGKDVSDHLYTLDYDFQVLKNFTQSLTKVTSEDHPKPDWMKIFNVTEESDFMKIVRAKGHFGKQMLIIVHGALAKEVVNQNPILSYKISPGLVHTTTLVTAANRQLDDISKELVKMIKQTYPGILETVVRTALDEEKTYKSLSAHSEVIMCNGVENAKVYLNLPSNVNDEAEIVNTMCEISRTLEDGLKKDSHFGKAIKNIQYKQKMMEEVKWTVLINGLKNLYIKLENDYPYLFEFNSYGLSEKKRADIEKMVDKAKSLWFGNESWGNSVHLGLKFGFRLMDLVDREIFNVTGEGWLKMKYVLHALNGPLSVVDDFIQTVSAIYQNELDSSPLPQKTVEALEQIIPNFPQLIVDATETIINGDTELTPVIEALNADPPWPCSKISLSDLISLSSQSKVALRAIETIWCLDLTFKDEWTNYLKEKNVVMFDMKKWNTTVFPPHIFLNFSSAVDGVIKDGHLLKSMAESMGNEEDNGMDVTWNMARRHVITAFQREDRDIHLGDFFQKVDTVLSAVNTSVLSISDSNSSSLHNLWSEYLSCGNGQPLHGNCSHISRLAWKKSLQFAAFTFKSIAGDLLEYLTEINEPNANLLQLIGFTRNTTLYELYDKLPDLIGVLLHSYWDYGFMSQIRRASLYQFWDCEAVVESLLPPPGSRVDKATIHRIQPYVCPSMFYWLSLPTGNNKLLDVVAKPQYYFFGLPSENLTSTYKDAYTTSMQLLNLMSDVSEKKQTLLTEEDIKMNSLQYKFERIVDSFINYRINETDPSYRLFYDINKKHFLSSIYLTRIVTMINKIATAVEGLKIEDVNASEEDKSKIEVDLLMIQKTFKRRSVDIIALHFDVITDLLWKNNKDYALANALESTCKDLKNNDTSKIILVDNIRVKNQICSKMYIEIYKTVEKEIEDYQVDARDSLLNLIEELRGEQESNVTNVFQFINQRSELVAALRHSIHHAFELTLPIYLQYLHSNLQQYQVIATLLSGGLWWEELRMLYNGPRANKFFDSVEISFEIVEDVLNGLDRIHAVRFLRDININNTDAFCLPNITLSEYIPDGTGRLSELKQDICAEDKSDLYREIPPLVFASQGYDINLKLSKDINYTSLLLELGKTQAKIDLMNGPRSPERPSWVTEDKIKHLRQITVGLLSKESLTRIAFGVIGNVADASTLYLNSSQCAACSFLTSWLKQLNLQIFKKQEYDNLLCRLNEMSLPEVHRALQNDFHWDMAISELIQTRNYTKFELNKSLNEFLEQVKLHLLDDMTADSTKLSLCLAQNVTKNAFGNITLFVNVLSHVARLLRAEAPHIHQVEGITSIPYLTKLSSQVAPNLDVSMPLKKYLKTEVEEELEKTAGNWSGTILGGEVNLRLVQNNQSVDKYIKLTRTDWGDICETQNCSKISSLIQQYINRSMVENDLQTLQEKEFWRFNFISNILLHIEELLNHAGRLVGVFSSLDVSGAMEGRLVALVDLLVKVLMDEVANDIVYSLQGLVIELHPLLQNSSLEFDVKALGTGLTILQQFKRYLLENEDLKLEVSSLFSHPERIEQSLGRLGINNTNFWSLAAPRVHASHIDIKPILTSKPDTHISDFVCQMEPMSQVLSPANLDVVTADDVYAAIVEQFCGLPDDTAKEIVAVLLRNLNFTTVVEKVTNTLLPQLYSAANLTESEGSAVLEQIPEMVSIFPTLKNSLGDLDDLMSEPLIQSLKSSSSVGSLLGSPDFLPSAGKLLCGRSFSTDQNRFYKAIAASKDYSDQPDQAQLDVLPTDFCRDLYKEIMSVNGGKIVWTFVKPLIMGKILYTPASPAVQRIIEQANSSFAHMIKLTTLLHSFAASLPSIDELSLHREGLSALMSPTFSDLQSMVFGDGELPDINVDGLLDKFGGFKGMLKTASNMLRCFNLNRFRAVSDEYQLTHEAVKLSRVNEFSAGLVFLNENQSDDLKHVEYKIRMDIENTPTTARMKNYLWIPGPESSFIEHMRYFRGFIQIQDLVDNAIIQLSRSNTSRSKRETRTEDKWAVYTQQEPYPCYKKDFFQTSLYESQALMVAFFFSLLFTVASTVRFIVADKESGNTMLMSVMGVNLTNHTLSWFISSLVEIILTVICMCIVLHAGGILPHTDPTLVFTLLMVFGLSVLAFCYMMSKMFKSASLAAVCSAIAYLVTFMPFVLILSLEAVLSKTLKLIVCLSMTSSICYAFLNITRSEARGAGVGWSDVTHAADDDLSIAAAAAMALVDAVLFFLVGYLIDKFFGLKTEQSSITNSTLSGEKAGVSVINVSKIYGAGTRRQKVALDNVSIELHKGQVTTLLGHNGAGKTTLINILTGMLKPTKGNVIIRSEHARSSMRAGVCPQKDVLFECLTAVEHVALYAQLKSGLPLEMVQDEVDNMLQVLSLGPVSQEPVYRLSGGTRRRLCVALAFVARPDLVSLDEPTAGVDPAARREIWSMIVKLREDRTILMTTHHLDEAELLSDQIVIMHKGQVHTTGSPIEIKRSLGNGYKLSVTYPKYSDPWPEEETIEERTKQLMAVVKDLVKNAGFVEINGLEVEITLPFFDADGVNNNFLQLCLVLEQRQEALGYKSYALDCSSLEHVFFNICHQADTPDTIQFDPEVPSKSASTSSVRSDNTPLVPAEGPLRGSATSQLLAMLHARYIHYTRNRWLLFLLIVLPSLFVTTAMAFSTVRPPADNEIALTLQPKLYSPATEYLVPRPSVYSNMDSSFAERVMNILRSNKQTSDWTLNDTPNCTCTETKQVCEELRSLNQPEMMLLPDVDTLNRWIVATHDDYIEKRYGGYTSALKNNITYLIAWYNNKGHHSMPAYLNTLNSAILKAVTGDDRANITVYSHPLKISEEQLSKDTVYQHVADAGISALVLLAYSLVSAGAAIYLVSTRCSQQKRLQLLCGVTPARYWAHALIADMLVIVINMVITVIVFEAFGFPVFVSRSNLPAICLLIFLFGYACGCFIHVAEKLFTEPSIANMVLFCGNAFAGLAGITILLILDIISDSDQTDNVRWYLHKLLLLCPQFVLGDGMLEIAKNTIQAQVLNRFGMDTYKDPLTTELIVYHYIALVVVGTALLLLNLAIEYDYFESILDRFRSESVPEKTSGEMEDLEVAAERKRVHVDLYESDKPVRLPTIGNINAGFVDTEVKNNSIKRYVSVARDVAQCVSLSKTYATRGGQRVAVRALTLGIPPGQCTALLGQNGAGKSTTFAMLTGELRPTSGQIYLTDIKASPRELCRGLISYCPQSDAIDPLLTARETLQFYCKLRGIDESEEVIKRAIDVFDLTKYADVRNGTLSGGNKRKLCTAVAFMGRTPLVLLDEPTSGMDPVSRACVSRGAGAARAGGRGVLLSTHALADARRLCARVALMRGGRLCALAPLDDCLKRFGGGYVVWCRVRRDVRAAWRVLRAEAPHARLRVLHHQALHFLIPTNATVDGKEVTTNLSDIFLLMGRLQSTCDIEDYTVNQSSLDQMFLTFTDKGEEEQEPTDLEPLPVLASAPTQDVGDLSSITSL